MIPPSVKYFLFISLIITIFTLKQTLGGGGCSSGVGFYPAWTHWSACNVTCGGGGRMRECRCFDDNDVNSDEESGCNVNTVNLRVADKETCNTQACPDDDDELEGLAIIAIVGLTLLKFLG